VQQRLVRLEFRGGQLSFDGGWPVMRERDDALGLSGLGSSALCDNRKGKNTVHQIDGLFGLFGRSMGGWRAMKTLTMLTVSALIPSCAGLWAHAQAVRRRCAVGAQAALALQMGGSKPGRWPMPGNREAPADLNGAWTCRFHERNGLKYIVLDMDGSVGPTDGDQEASVWNGHFDCTCYHPNFLFDRFGMPERCALRNGNVHSAEGRQDVLDPVIARYVRRDIMRFFRADAAYAMPAIHARLEESGYFCAIRLPADAVLRSGIAHRMTRPAGRPSQTKVKRLYEDIAYQAQSHGKPRQAATSRGG